MDKITTERFLKNEKVLLNVLDYIESLEERIAFLEQHVDIQMSRIKKK
jgi:hypothetical protein